MNEEEKQKVRELIDKIKKIALEKYNGDLYGNVLNIFRVLSVSEKRLLIRSAIERSHELDSSDIVYQVPEGNKEMDIQIEKEIKDIETLDKQELIRLKSWFTKVLVLFIFTMIGIIVISNIFLQTSFGLNLDNEIEHIFRIFRTMFER